MLTSNVQLIQNFFVQTRLRPYFHALPVVKKAEPDNLKAFNFNSVSGF
jgi:hypothetical protein